MKTFKKALAVVMCVVMTLTAAPLVGLVGLELPSLFDFEAEAASYSGTCGDNLNWSLDKDTGVLKITGTGDMEDYKYSDAPWSKYSSYIKTVNIADGVTSIGDYAFYYPRFNYLDLTSIAIPDSVTSIGEFAFAGTEYYYNSDNWIDNVLYIGKHLIDAKISISGSYSIEHGTLTIADYAFASSDSLTSITIPNSVKSIGSFAFENCTGLTSITIPNSVISIGEGSFKGCKKLESITLPFVGSGRGGSGPHAVFGFIFGYTSSKQSGTTRQNYSFDFSSPDSNRYHYYYYIPSSLKNVVITDETDISFGAFHNCGNLTNITLSDSVKSIDSTAFINCSSLISITIPDSVTSIVSHAYSIECETFRGCTSLTRVTVEPDNEYYSSDEYGVLFNKDKSVLIHYPGGNTSTSYTIPNSVTSIDSYAFYNCKSLASIIIPDSMTSIGVSVFSGCASLTSVTIPDSIISISSYAFEDCNSLTSITIPYSVTKIAGYAFYGCSKINTTYYTGTQEEWNEITIGSNNGNLSKNIIFESNSEKPYFGMGSCGEKLTWKLYADGKLEIIGTGDMEDYTSSSSAPWYAYRSMITSVTISDNTTSIGDYAFYNCTGFTDISIPNSVTSIGLYAFKGCVSLAEVKILGYSVDIANNAFVSCPNVILYCKSGSSAQSYAELNNMMYVLIDGASADFAVKNNQLVSYDGSAASPTIPSGITSIGSNAFKDNATVKSLELPSSTTSIFSGAFSGCTNLERIVIPHTVTTIAADAFNGTNATIVCYANSYAHNYAVENSIDYEIISVTLNETKVVLGIGEYSIITATPEQDYISSVPTTWKSSDTSVATVDANGKVTAITNGEATIYALAPNGETLAACSVRVTIDIELKIKNPSTTTINYGETLVMHADFGGVELPECWSIQWTVEGAGFNMAPAADGLTCKMTSVANGNATVKATLVDENGEAVIDADGNEMSDSKQLTSKAGFWQKFVSFFKNLFGISRIILQSI